MLSDNIQDLARGGGVNRIFGDEETRGVLDILNDAIRDAATYDEYAKRKYLHGFDA